MSEDDFSDSSIETDTREAPESSGSGSHSAHTSSTSGQAISFAAQRPASASSRPIASTSANTIPPAIPAPAAPGPDSAPLRRTFFQSLADFNEIHAQLSAMQPKLVNAYETLMASYSALDDTSASLVGVNLEAIKKSELLVLSMKTGEKR